MGPEILFNNLVKEVEKYTSFMILYSRVYLFANSSRYILKK